MAFVKGTWGSLFKTATEMTFKLLTAPCQQLRVLGRGTEEPDRSCHLALWGSPIMMLDFGAVPRSPEQWLRP